MSGTSPVVNIALGALVAATLAALAAVPEIAGVSTWKIVLGAIGLILFISGGRRKAT